MRRHARVMIVALVTVAASMLLVGQAAAVNLSMGGTFTMNFTSGTPGADLLPIVGNENSWTILLEGVEYECSVEWDAWITTLRATSFEFEFFGPDAAVLNSEVADHFTQGGLGGDGYFEVRVEDFGGGYLYWSFIFYIWPIDTFYVIPTQELKGGRMIYIPSGKSNCCWAKLAQKFYQYKEAWHLLNDIPVISSQFEMFFY